jgi:DNA-binding LacI/PurR family transcriptional regulator
MKRVTIKDLAKKLNINPSTVSRALHNHPDVSADMTAAVQKLADKMGYKPNQMAINLRNGHNKTIGLIVPEISMFFLPSVMKAVEEATHERGYNLLILHSNDSVQRESENAELCLFNGVEGVLVSLTKQTHDIEHFAELSYSGTPVVYFDKVLQPTHAHKIVISDENAAQQAAEQLLARVVNMARPTRICGFFGDARLAITQDRVLGFTAALTAAAHECDSDNLFFVDTIDSAYTTLKTLWQQPTRPNALFVMSDEILTGVMKAIGELRINVPAELQIVAMSDGFVPQFMVPPIPYIETSGYRMGKQAAELLFNLIAGQEIEPDTNFIDTPFVG